MDEDSALRRRSSSFEDRFPCRVTQVGALDVGEQNEPVHVELIAAVADLGHRPHRHREAGASQAGRNGRRLRPQPGGRPRSPRRPFRHPPPSSPRWIPGVEIDSSEVAIPMRSIRSTWSIGRPSRDLGHPIGVRVTCLLKCRPVRLREVVSVHIELAGRSSRMIHVPSPESSARLSRASHADQVDLAACQGGDPAAEPTPDPPSGLAEQQRADGVGVGLDQLVRLRDRDP